MGSATDTLIGVAKTADGNKPKLRILHLIPSFGEGGAERQLSLLAPALAERGIECHIAFNEGGIHLYKVTDGSVVLHRLPKRHNAHPARILDLVRIIRQVRPDIVQTWLTQMDVFGAIAAKICGMPYILSERASAAAYPAHWKNRLRSMLGRSANVIVANAAVGADYWHHEGATQPIIVIPNAIVTDRDNIVPDEVAHLPSAKLLLSAGRFSEEKNIDGLIAGIDRALDRLPDHQAIIFGDGHLREAVYAQVSSARNAARIFLPGFTEHLGFWRQRSDVFVSVTHQEGSPNVVLEAASEQCPLVLSDIPGHRECLSKDAAIWVDKDSPETIADGICKVALDRELAQRLAANAHADVSRYTLESAVDQYCQTYSALAGQVPFPQDHQGRATWETL